MVNFSENSAMVKLHGGFSTRSLGNVHLPRVRFTRGLFAVSLIAESPPVGPVLVPNGVMTCDDKGTPDYPTSFDHAMYLGKL